MPINPKTDGSGIIGCTPQAGACPRQCPDCYFQESHFYTEVPYIPSIEDAEGRVVRMNDGNDSNHERSLVVRTASKFKDVFFNTSYPTFGFTTNGIPRPVVFTVNPGNMTDVDFYRVDYDPSIMFVRFRLNLWNVEVAEECVVYYTRYLEPAIPVVMTYMRYLKEDSIPPSYRIRYTRMKHISNEYFSMRSSLARYLDFTNKFGDYRNVYCCGSRRSDLCKDCGVCLREYFAAKERLRVETHCS